MKVQAKVKCFVGNALREKGEIFDYAGPENGCLEVLEEKPVVVKGGKLPPGKKPADEAFE